MKDLSGAESFFECWHEHNNSWNVILNARQEAPELADLFRLLDPSLYRFAFFTGVFSLEKRQSTKDRARTCAV